MDYRATLFLVENKFFSAKITSDSIVGSDPKLGSYEYIISCSPHRSLVR